MDVLAKFIDVKSAGEPFFVRGDSGNRHTEPGPRTPGGVTGRNAAFFTKARIPARLDGR